MNNDTENLLRDIQFWMMDNDYNKTKDGNEIFNRISKVLDINWDKPMNGETLTI